MEVCEIYKYVQRVTGHKSRLAGHNTRKYIHILWSWKIAKRTNPLNQFYLKLNIQQDCTILLTEKSQNFQNMNKQNSTLVSFINILCIYISIQIKLWVEKYSYQVDISIVFQFLQSIATGAKH